MWSKGSSPRMRGAPDVEVGESDDVRIIPAYAGSTTAGKALSSSYKDHPRVCGEHLAHVCASPYHQGSSPRMRGAHESERLHLC